MGLNRVCNPAKIRKLTAMVGAPVVRAYSRFFADQKMWIVFTDDTTAFVVNTRTGEVAPYTEESLVLAERGVGRLPKNGS